MKKELEVFASLHEESKKGWVWTPKLKVIEGDLIRVTNPEKGRSVVCEKRILDDNYVEVYNSRRSTRKIENPDNSIVMNAHYRARLGNFPTGKSVLLEIEEAKG